MAAPQQLEFDLGHMTMSALAWGPEDGRLALCVHGFPDSVVIGHDWGSVTVGGITALPQSPFAAHIGMSTPPLGAFSPRRRDILRYRRLLLKQLRMSWYITYFQLSVLPERTLPTVIPRLWRTWCAPGFDIDTGVADALAALPGPAYRAAAVAYYRAMLRPGAVAPQYAELHSHHSELPRVPILFLPGNADGALQPGFAQFLEEYLPAGSRVQMINDAGHFMQLEQPDQMADAILSYLGTGS